MLCHDYCRLSEPFNEKLQNINVGLADLLRALLFVVVIKQLELFNVFTDSFVLVVFYSSVDVLELIRQELLRCFDILILVLSFCNCELTFGSLQKLLFVLLCEIVVGGEPGKKSIYLQ
jgi:hypothetical protein